VLGVVGKRVSVPKNTQKDPPSRLLGQEIPDWLLQGDFADEEIRNYVWAATRCGLELAHWARSTLNAAAKAILEIDEDH
jgi:hypothetical protein